MRIAVVLGSLATLALAGIASAATPKGHLTGGADVTTSFGIERIVTNSSIDDGERVNVAKMNDKSNDCNDDTGAVNIRYGPGDGRRYEIICAHYTGEGMGFYYDDTKLGKYVVVYIVDGGSPARNDHVAVGAIPDDTPTNAQLALQWVNRGYAGSGAKKLGMAFPQVAASRGNYTIHR